MAFNTSRLEPDYDFLYKPLRDAQDGGCHLSLWLPEKHGGQVPVVMMFHGGAWTVGSSLTIPYNQVRHLLSLGLAVASIDTRLLPHATLQDMREDSLDAYRYLLDGANADLCAEASPVMVDAKRAAAVGWSAGATLAIYLAHDILQDPSLPHLKALQPTYPLTDFSLWPGSPADLANYLDAHPDFRALLDGIRAEPVSAAWEWKAESLGPPREGVEPEKRMVLFQTLLSNGLIAPLLISAPPPYTPHSPISLPITSSFPPTHLLIAGGDTTIPLSQSHDFVTKLDKAGVEVQASTAEGMAHAVAECLHGAPEWTKEEAARWWPLIVGGLEWVRDKVGP